jgi:hypothetical protein
VAAVHQSLIETAGAAVNHQHRNSIAFSGNLYITAFRFDDSRAATQVSLYPL